MSTPKLQRILDAVADRLAGIKMGNGYFTDAGQQVVRGRHSLDGSRLPGCAAYVDARNVATAVERRATVDCTITVEVLGEYGDTEPEVMACRFAADVQTAMESGDRTLDGLLLDQRTLGLAWQSDEFIYPENQDHLVGVRVTYAMPHIRRPGDPIN